jgi:hypothetical protein
MRLLLGGIAIGIDDTALGQGNHLIAKLSFGSSNLEISVDTISVGIGTDFPLYVTTMGAYPPGSIDYQPKWRPACCGPVVPTLSEWGLIIFSFLLLASLIFYLRRRTSTI